VRLDLLRRLNPWSSLALSLKKAGAEMKQQIRLEQEVFAKQIIKIWVNVCPIVANLEELRLITQLRRIGVIVTFLVLQIVIPVRTECMQRP
jgi:hypothetical protein